VTVKKPSTFSGFCRETRQKFVKKLLALNRSLDIFSAPFCPEGKPSARRCASAALSGRWSAWVQADN
jgi:hypothetical protein